MNQTIDISIVIPSFNEEGNVMAMYEALIAALEPLGRSFEIIFCDDGSKDATFSIVQDLHQRDSRVQGISLSRNYGYQIALYAGLETAIGEHVVTMDGDLQHPPSFIPTLLAQHDEGYDIVNARREDYNTNSFLKKFTSKLFYKLINVLSDVYIEPASADFRSMKRIAVRALLDMPERQRFTRGLVKWMGFEAITIPYPEEERHSGTTKFSYVSLLRLGLDGVMSFSVKPLRIAFIIGALVSLGALVYAIYAVVVHFMGMAVAGWTSLLVSVLFLGGTILLSLGVIGEYVARIYNEVRARPMYYIKRTTITSKPHGQAEAPRS